MNKLLDNIRRFIFKDKFRVLEVSKGDQSSTFFPQSRLLPFVWKPILNGARNAQSFQSLQAANDFIYKRQSDARAANIVGKKAHSFNEVFHKLKHD